MKIQLLLLATFGSILLSGCGEPAPEPEKAPKGPQQVVMVPAQGKGSPAAGAETTTPAAPVATGTAMPDAKAPGDK